MLATTTLLQADNWNMSKAQREAWLQFEKKHNPALFPTSVSLSALEKHLNTVNVVSMCASSLYPFRFVSDSSQWQTAIVHREPSKSFHFVDPLIAASMWLRNPFFRSKMIFDPLQLSGDDRSRGHFCSKAIFLTAFREAQNRNALPLVFGHWSDETGVSFGSTGQYTAISKSIVIMIDEHLFSSESATSSAHPMLVWLLNLPIDIWALKKGRATVGLVPRIDDHELDVSVRKLLPEIKSSILHVCLGLLFRSFITLENGTFIGCTATCCC
jgi:hypothetical protein